MPFITAQEVAAHARISELLTARVQRKVTRDYTERAFSYYSPAFAPRCNCMGVLSVVRHPDGVVSMRCGSCGHRHREHKL